MLKDGILTTLHEFIVTTHQINESNRRVWTEYGIQYDGSSESINDIAIFVGGFPYGTTGETLRIVNTVLLAQGRPPEDCIDEIAISDWVVLTCGKIFGADDEYMHRGKKEVEFNKERFNRYYGSVKYSDRPKFNYDLRLVC